MTLTATNLSKTIAGQQILSCIDVSLAPGRLTCVIGPSGAGKTTLLRALAMIEAPDTGTVKIDKHEYAFPRTEEEALKPLEPCPWPDLTVVFQSLFLWPHMSLRENILLPARKLYASEAEAESALTPLIGAFDMAHFIDSYPNQASLGQRQRIALARALMLKPRYILMDEITSALDVEQVAKILKHLQGLKAQGIGMLVITHLLGFARRAADQIVFMDEGKIVETGGPEILDTPKSQRLQRFVKIVEEAR